MTRNFRPRRLAKAGLAAAAALLLSACAQEYPNSTFNHTTEFNTEIDKLWDSLLLWGTIVFVITEGILIYTIFRYRKRPDSPPPQNVHGNTLLELGWTLTPALILVLIAVPTVRAIFATQARALPTALQVEVIGHQWWWEFRYPEYGITTANELYLPTGRTANFALKTADVLHSFWIPQLGGKRDLISNRTNYLWFTPDTSLGTVAYNGTCNEFCGTSHANMKFRTFVLPPEEFAKWVAHQQTPAAFGAVAPAPAAAAAAPQNVDTSRATATTPTATTTATPAYEFPRERVQAYNIPSMPLPEGITFPDGLTGDAARGQAVYSRSACIACHVIKGNPMSIGVIGPDLTHFGSRLTLAAGMFPNDSKHLAYWLKNARLLKPGSTMPTLGKDQYDPIAKMRITAGGLTDQQIADIVAYLQALK